MNEPEKSYTLKLSWKRYLFHYLICVALIPVFGIGLLAAVYVFSRHYTSFYRITDDKIMIAIAGKEPVSLNIGKIDSTRTEYSWLDSKTGIGTLILTHQKDSEQYRLEGLDNPEKLKTILDLAIRQEKDQKEFKEDVDQHAPRYSPGTLDPMNDLVGLWQQGLITDEQFEEEKKKFE